MRSEVRVGGITRRRSKEGWVCQRNVNSQSGYSTSINIQSSLLTRGAVRPHGEDEARRQGEPHKCHVPESVERSWEHKRGAAKDKQCINTFGARAMGGRGRSDGLVPLACLCPEERAVGGGPSRNSDTVPRVSYAMM